MRILNQLAVDSDNFFNRVGLRNVRVRKGNIELLPRPLITRSGVVPTEGLGGELGQESVDGWVINCPTATLEKLFGTNWREQVNPLDSNWEINEDSQGWRKVRVSEQYVSGESGRVSFQLLALGFDIM